MFDRLVFVEGTSDESILRELASASEINLTSPAVGFVTMEGSRNIQHYVRDRSRALLTERNVQMTFVIDRDERTDDEVESILSHGSESLKIHILSKRELENYFLIPTVLDRYITAQRQRSGAHSAGPEPTIENISAALGEEADGLKDIVTAKRLIRVIGKPIYFDFRDTLDSESLDLDSICTVLQEGWDTRRIEHRELKSLYDELRRETEEIWPSKKLDIVPGALLIDRICKRFGVRYKKARDAALLASVIEPGEVLSEISLVVSSFRT